MKENDAMGENIIKETQSCLVNLGQVGVTKDSVMLSKFQDNLCKKKPEKGLFCLDGFIHARFICLVFFPLLLGIRII